MDRMVEHLFAFEGDGVIKDYPGNYTQYRAYVKEIEAGTRKDDGKMVMGSIVEKAEAKQIAPINSSATKKLSFKEKEEIKNLDKEIPTLQKEKEELETKMSSNNCIYPNRQSLYFIIRNIAAHFRFQFFFFFLQCWYFFI